MLDIRSAALVGLIATLQACTPAAPSSIPAATSSLRVATSQKATGSSSLLYVSDEDQVYVYAYPKGRLLQKLQILSSTGVCVDGSSVFITAYNADYRGRHLIYEYAHGASQPYYLLRDSGYPVGCSIDPTTHTLAVANAMSASNGDGNVMLWNTTVTAAAPRAVYSNLPFPEPMWCSYDNAGNLFVDGENYGTRGVSLAELPKGASGFKTISLDISLGYPPGHIQWDGKYITISVGNVIYQLSVSGSSATVVGSTKLPAYWSLNGYSIVGAWLNAKTRKLIGTAGESIGYFSYPSGSGPTRTLIENGDPLDAVVSPP